LDQTLAKSDAKYIEEGDVTVDVSLFEHEGDLSDLEEEDDMSVLELVRSSAD
jgi:hypothetical protein